MINESAISVKLDEVQTMGGLILFVDDSCRVNESSGDIGRLKENVGVMIGYVDDMSAGIDELIALLEAK